MDIKILFLNQKFFPTKKELSKKEEREDQDLKAMIEVTEEEVTSEAEAEEEEAVEVEASEEVSEEASEVAEAASEVVNLEEATEVAMVEV